MSRLLAGRNVLVVEDEMLVLFAIEVMLEDLGCNSIAAASTVDQALCLIEERSFDAAILDVNLDGQQSYPVADALSARGVPFAFSTGYGRLGLKDGYRERPVLTKPYRTEDLVAAISGVLPNLS